MQMCSEDLRTKERSEMEAEVPKGYDEGGEGDWHVAPAGSGLWSVRAGFGYWWWRRFFDVFLLF